MNHMSKIYQYFVDKGFEEIYRYDENHCRFGKNLSDCIDYEFVIGCRRCRGEDTYEFTVEYDKQCYCELVIIPTFTESTMNEVKEKLVSRLKEVVEIIEFEMRLLDKDLQRAKKASELTGRIF